MSFRDADQLVAKDLASAAVLQKWVENIQRTGTFSERRPDLGKMHKCAFCGRRHRMIGPRCSNADYASTQRAWDSVQGFHQVECQQRVVEQMFGKKMFRKVMHKRHGQNRTNAARALTARMQNDGDLVAQAVREMAAFQPHMRLKVPDIAGIPAFAATYYRFKEDAEQRRIRCQRRVAQQVNRGLRPKGSRYIVHG